MCILNGRNELVDHCSQGNLAKVQERKGFLRMLNMWRTALPFLGYILIIISKGEIFLVRLLEVVTSSLETVLMIIMKITTRKKA